MSTYPIVPVVSCLVAVLAALGCERHPDSEPKTEAAIPVSASEAGISPNDVGSRRQAIAQLSSQSRFFLPIEGDLEVTAARDAFYLLLESPGNIRVFSEMVDSSNWVTALYGLVGLFYVHPVKYCQLVGELHKKADQSHAAVTVRWPSDLEEQVLVSDLLAKPSGYRLFYGETIPEHCWRVNQRFALDRLDFTGGSIPLLWLDVGSNDILRGGMPSAFGDSGEGLAPIPDIDISGLWIFRGKARFNSMWYKCFRTAVERDGADEVPADQE